MKDSNKAEAPCFQASLKRASFSRAETFPYHSAGSPSLLFNRIIDSYDSWMIGHVAATSRLEFGKGKLHMLVQLAEVSKDSARNRHSPRTMIPTLLGLAVFSACTVG